MADSANSWTRRKGPRAKSIPRQAATGMDLVAEHVRLDARIVVHAGCHFLGVNGETPMQHMSLPSRTGQTIDRGSSASSEKFRRPCSQMTSSTPSIITGCPMSQLPFASVDHDQDDGIQALETRSPAPAGDPLTLIDVDDQDSGRTGTLVSGPTES